MAESTVNRTRNFRAIIWQESADPNWISKLDGTLIPYYRVYHDMDIEDGVPKKPHFHVVLKFDAPKTIKQVTTILKECCGDGCNTALRCDSLHGALLYLIHRGWPDKHQYDITDVVASAGLDYVSDIISSSDLIKAREDIQLWIEENNITSYYDLSWFATNINKEWSRCVNSQTLYWVKYLISREDKLKTHIYSIVDNIRSDFYVD